jgi:hypothetical protein
MLIAALYLMNILVEAKFPPTFQGDDPDFSRQRSVIDSPSSRRATKRSLSSIFDCSFHGIATSRQSGKCYPCVQYNLSPMSRAAQACPSLTRITLPEISLPGWYGT